jgi:hypothetical protein
MVIYHQGLFVNACVPLNIQKCDITIVAKQGAALEVLLGGLCQSYLVPLPILILQLAVDRSCEQIGVKPSSEQ